MIERLRLYLGSDADNSPLVLWRIFWGFLIFCESIGAILTGWVQETFMDATFTFTFIGFEWLQPLPGHGMHVYFGVMALVGLSIMFGFRYRLSSTVFFLMWTAVYLMQKSHYNNHYYLMVILAFIMILVPANRFKSLDVRLGYVKERLTCARWNILLFVLIVGLVYVVASLNKIHYDWLQARPLKVWFSYKTNYFLIGPLLGKEWFAYVIAYGGILYDGLIFFILLHPRTRNFGFVLSLIFNLFNSAVFQIGIFPYMMIAFTVFFYSGDWLRSRFFRKSSPVTVFESKPMSRLAFYVFIGFFLVNMLLPLRHHLYPGDVHWTEEGHRLSWQMMLRSKGGAAVFEVRNKATGEKIPVNLRDHLTANQRADCGLKPDMTWQFAQYLKRHFASQNTEVEVYCKARVSLNGYKAQYLIDPTVDLAAVDWERFKHAHWILDENRPTE